MCQIAGVGEGGGGEEGGDDHPAAMQTAMADVRSGAAFQATPYADSVADFVRPPPTSGAAEGGAEGDGGMDG